MSQIKIYDPCSEEKSTGPGARSLNAAGIVVCRLDSTRLPGKVLKTVQGAPLLKWVIDRVHEVQEFNRGVIVATSDRTIDDPISEFCKAHKIKVFRGSANDVSGRILNCAVENDLDWFARINADSPFVDADLLERACRIAASDRFDFITNLSPRSYPYGVSVEMIRTTTFQEAYQQMCSSDHFEHVTQIFYESTLGLEFRKYNILNMAENQSQIRLTVDTPEDWQLFCRLAEISNNDNLSFQQATQIIQSPREAV
ncbi:MAG: NTP transferase domain-containing protein [Planctomycetota bacterium]|nr:NTP transferase domain-containing protein [Planctomycetota bacterium]